MALTDILFSIDRGVTNFEIVFIDICDIMASTEEEEILVGIIISHEVKCIDSKASFPENGEGSTHKIYINL